MGRDGGAQRRQGGGVLEPGHDEIHHIADAVADGRIVEAQGDEPLFRQDRIPDPIMAYLFILLMHLSIYLDHQTVRETDEVQE